MWKLVLLCLISLFLPLVNGQSDENEPSGPCKETSRIRQLVLDNLQRQEINENQNSFESNFLHRSTRDLINQNYESFDSYYEHDYVDSEDLVPQDYSEIGDSSALYDYAYGKIPDEILVRSETSGESSEEMSISSIEEEGYARNRVLSKTLNSNNRLQNRFPSRSNSRNLNYDSETLSKINLLKDKPVKIFSNIKGPLINIQTPSLDVTYNIDNLEIVLSEGQLKEFVIPKNKNQINDNEGVANGLNTENPTQNRYLYEKEVNFQEPPKNQNEPNDNDVIIFEDLSTEDDFSDSNEPIVQNNDVQNDYETFYGTPVPEGTPPMETSNDQIIFDESYKDQSDDIIIAEKPLGDTVELDDDTGISFEDSSGDINIDNIHPPRINNQKIVNNDETIVFEDISENDFGSSLADEEISLDAINSENSLDNNYSPSYQNNNNANEDASIVFEESLENNYSATDEQNIPQQTRPEDSIIFENKSSEEQDLINNSGVAHIPQEQDEPIIFEESVQEFSDEQNQMKPEDTIVFEEESPEDYDLINPLKSKQNIPHQIKQEDPIVFTDAAVNQDIVPNTQEEAMMEEQLLQYTQPTNEDVDLSHESLEETIKFVMENDISDSSKENINNAGYQQKPSSNTNYNNNQNTFIFNNDEFNDLQSSLSSFMQGFHRENPTEIRRNRMMDTLPKETDKPVYDIDVRLADEHEDDNEIDDTIDILDIGSLPTEDELISFLNALKRWKQKIPNLLREDHNQPTDNKESSEGEDFS